MTDTVRVPRDGPDIIWLEPSCCADPRHGRQWCEDDAFPVCEDEHEPVKYIRADLAASPQGEGSSADGCSSDEGAGGWTIWHGGPNPAPGQIVSAIWNGEEHDDRLSDDLDWDWNDTCDPITAYRVTEGVKP